MSRFEARTKVIESYWRQVFGNNPTGSCCIALSVLLLSALYLIALLWMVPASVFISLREVS